MNCFKSISIQEQTIQKSRFIGYTFTGETKQDIFRQLQLIAKEHPHASHLAYAYQLKSEHGFEPYYSDAGEPSGTAGKPLLQLIDAHQIVGGGIGVILRVPQEHRDLSVVIIGLGRRLNQGQPKGDILRHLLTQD
ncbi:MAG: YigZ family protein [Methylocystaceae bacterium]|nr:YigZ family protein [Methylocystaceae bacterium]